MRLHVAFLIAALAAPAVAYAQPLSRVELQVLARHRLADVQAIQLGQLAQQHGKGPGVQAFGGTLARDHARDLAALDTFARRHGATIPAVEPATEAERQRLDREPARMARLRAASGAEFDRLFLDQVIEHHARELASLDGDLALVQHAKLRRLLRSLRPVLQRHLAKARTLDESNAQAMRDVR